MRQMDEGINTITYLLILADVYYASYLSLALICNAVTALTVLYEKCLRRRYLT